MDFVRSYEACQRLGNLTHVPLVEIGNIYIYTYLSETILYYIIINYNPERIVPKNHYKNFNTPNKNPQPKTVSNMKMTKI